MGQFVILGTWLFEGFVRRDIGEKFSIYFKDRVAITISFIFFLHLIGLAYTSNMSWGLDLCRILLPFLLLPVVAPSIKRFSESEWLGIMGLFVLSTLLTSVYGSIIHSGAEEWTFRQLSPFISHIRMALMVAMSIFIMVWFFPKVNSVSKVIFTLVILWFLQYLDQMHSVQGMVIVVLGVAIILLMRSYILPDLWRISVRALALVIPLMALSYVAFCYWEYYDVEPIVFEELETHSAGGEKYFHDTDDPIIENGRYVWTHVAWNELGGYWHTRSEIPFEENDAKGQPISATLIRYMASIQVTKDAEGLAKMTDQDIANVEAGIANIDMLDRSGLRNRVDQVFFELDRYRATGDPSGNSLTMRFEFWRAAIGIIKQNFWTGVGSGDTPEAFEVQYEEIDSPLATNMRFRAHNEYLTVFVSFGVFGFFAFMLALFYPFTKLGLFRHGLALAFFLTVLISFLTDDTLERQAGTTFVAYFYCLFLFMEPRRTK